jgi:hypothetical protein
VYAAGDTKAGVQTAAFNLPNDERVVKEKGTKRVMLKNVQQAKFDKVLRPIAAQALDPAQLPDLSFDAFFTHILAHELMHGLGPHNIRIQERATTPRLELQEVYSAIEEAKADITGLWALQYLIDKGVVDKAMEKPLYTTFLASAFRSIRFGIDEAHGRARRLQLNVLLDAGAFKVDPKTGKFAVDFRARPGRRSEPDARPADHRGRRRQGEGASDARPLRGPAAGSAAHARALESVPVDIEPLFATQP